MGNMLAMFVGKNQKDWDLYLQQVLLAYWTSYNESTGATPFSLLYGREARLPVDLCFDPPPNHNQPVATYGEYTEQLQKRLDTSFQLVRKKLQLSQKRQADEYDRKVWGSPYMYKQGDRVWLFNPSTPRGLSPKLTSHWTGPYIVKQSIRNTNYVIQLEAGRKVLTVHHNQLKTCRTPKASAHGNDTASEMQPIAPQ